MKQTIIKTLTLVLIMTLASALANAQTTKTIVSKNIGGWGSDFQLTQSVNLDNGDTTTLIIFANWEYKYATLDNGIVVIDNIDAFICRITVAQSKNEESVDYTDKFGRYTIRTNESDKYVWMYEGSKMGYMAKGQVKKLINALKQLKVI